MPPKNNSRSLRQCADDSCTTLPGNVLVLSPTDREEDFTVVISFCGSHRLVADHVAQTKYPAMKTFCRYSPRWLEIAQRLELEHEQTSRAGKDESTISVRRK